VEQIILDMGSVVQACSPAQAAARADQADSDSGRAGVRARNPRLARPGPARMERLARAVPGVDGRGHTVYGLRVLSLPGRRVIAPSPQSSAEGFVNRGGEWGCPG
jgi:hypothetical protein